MGTVSSNPTIADYQINNPTSIITSTTTTTPTSNNATNSTTNNLLTPTYNSKNPTLTAFLSTGLIVKQTTTGYTETAGSQQLSFPFSPNNINWNYTLNKLSFDTYGGRVTQILSVKIDTMTVQADAGSRANLMALFAGLKQMQTNQIETRAPIKFVVPSNTSDLSKTMLGNGGLTFWVWFKGISIGWDPTTVTYPFNLTFEVQDSSYAGYENGVNGYAKLSDNIKNTELQGLFNGATSNRIGYDTTVGQKNSSYYAGMQPIGSYSAVNPNSSTINGSQFLGLTGFGSNPV